MSGDESYDEHVRSGVDLGGGHFCHLQYRTPDGRIVGLPASQEPGEGFVLVGLNENHLRPDGSWCGGWVGFGNVNDPGPNGDGVLEPYRRGGVKHELVSADPLTVMPSLACRGCPSHGWIRDGRWHDA